MNVKIIAVAVVIVIVVAAAGAYLLLNPDKSDAYESPPLSIFGNANEDNTIDSKDVDIVNEIIAGDKILKDYPFADVNNDGTVDSADLDLLNKIVNREENIDIFIKDHGGTTVKINYPLNNIVTVNTDMANVIISIGAEDKVVGYTTGDYRIQLAPYIDSDGVFLGDEDRSIDEVGYKKLIEIDGDLLSEGGIGAIFIMTKEGLGTHADDYAAAGIPILTFHCSGPLESLDSALTMGFILGESSEKKGLEFSNYSRGILNEIASKVPESIKDRTKVLSFTMGKYMTQMDSQYTHLTEMAGANNITQFPGDGSEKMESKETLAKEEYKDVQNLISFRTTDLVLLDSEGIIKGWEAISGHTFWEQSPAYKETFLLNSSIPVIARVAYIAEQLYPDSIDAGYGDKVFQHVVENFLTYLNDEVTSGNFDVTKDVTTITTYEEYMAAKAANP